MRRAAAWGLVFVLLLGGCTAGPIRQARQTFYAQGPRAAADSLSQEQKSPSWRDRLLWRMEKGAILHHAGQYQKSAEVLLEAAQVMEAQQVISVSQQGASVVANEWLTQYKGEISERLWVHTYLMMDFLLLSRYESALVEAKQALKLFDAFPKALQKARFSRALIGLCFEQLGEYNGAYIEYKKLAGSDPAGMARLLFPLAKQLGFVDEARQYGRFLTHSQKEQALSNRRELVVFVASGRIERKVAGNLIVPPSIRISFPRYIGRTAPHPRLFLQAGLSAPSPWIRVSSDLNAVAKDALAARASRMIAKETFRAGLKEAVAQAVEEKNDDLVSVLVRAALFALEEPDTRCWQTLPARLDLVRIPLAPESGAIRMGIGAGWRNSDHLFQTAGLAPGQRAFYSVRAGE